MSQRDAQDRSLVPPLVRSVTHRFASAAELERYNRGEEPGLFLYGRYDNPTVREAEGWLARLQGAEEACLFASGMAAATTCFLANLSVGDEVLCANAVYGGVFRLLRDLAPRLGIHTRFVEPAALASAASYGPRTRLVHFETPINPTLRIVDAQAIARVARERGAVSTVDSTFAPPPLQRMEDLGVDLVVHSVTKYLNGHSDVLGGVAMGSAARIAPLRTLRRVLGNNADPAAAWELMRGMRTLEVRMAQQQRSAFDLAQRLSADPRVAQVSYPGLPGHPDHQLARRQMHGFGAMVTFTLPGGYPAAARFYDSLSLIERAASLGSVESLVSLPVISSHTGLSPAELAAAGVDPGMVRISVGLEPFDAILRDVEQALAKAIS